MKNTRDPKKISGCDGCNYQTEKGTCSDPNNYVNKNGEAVCGKRDDAIPYEDYIKNQEED